MIALAACHIHSNWSYDGIWPLEALAAAFGRRGYRVLMMAEHDLGFTEARRLEYWDACAQASTEKILVVPGIEYSDEKNIVHVLAWGDVPFCGEGVPTNRVLEAVRSAEGVAVLAHPSRRDAWKYFAPSWADTLTGVELWNRKCDGWAPSRTTPLLPWKNRLIPFAGLDFHDSRQQFALSMALDLGPDVTVENTLNALRSRKCQARVFGVPVEGRLFRKALPILNLAEHCRRRAARIYKKAKAKNPIRTEAINRD